MKEDLKHQLTSLLAEHRRLGIAEIGDKIGDKGTKKAKIGDKKATILPFIADNPGAKDSNIADFIGLKPSRTRDYLAQLVKEGLVRTEGANKNRTYHLAAIVR